MLLPSKHGSNNLYFIYFLFIYIFISACPIVQSRMHIGDIMISAYCECRLSHFSAWVHHSRLFIKLSHTRARFVVSQRGSALDFQLNNMGSRGGLTNEMKRGNPSTPDKPSTELSGVRSQSLFMWELTNETKKCNPPPPPTNRALS